MENLWEMIAKARGVELNEEFKWNDLTYKITDYDGLLVLDCSCVWMWVKSKGVLSFIRGGDDCVIEKIPFVPKMGEIYWSYYNNQEIYIETYCWNDSTFDKERKLLGIVFRTKQEANDYLTTWKKRLEGN